MSWLMKRTAKPFSRCRRRTFSRISCCTTTSRPVVGSSSRMNFGSSASASARLTRCFMPPDSSCGKEEMKVGSMRTVSKSSSTRRDTAAPRIDVCASMASRNWASMRATGLSEFMLLWKTVAISRHRIARSSSSGRWVMSLPVEDDLPVADPAGLLQEPQQRSGQRRLATAGLADEADELALVEGERHVVDRRQRCGALRLVAHRQVLDLEQCHLSPPGGGGCSAGRHRSSRTSTLS